MSKERAYLIPNENRIHEKIFYRFVVIRDHDFNSIGDISNGTFSLYRCITLLVTNCLEFSKKKKPTSINLYIVDTLHDEYVHTIRIDSASLHRDPHHTVARAIEELLEKVFNFHAIVRVADKRSATGMIYVTIKSLIDTYTIFSRPGMEALGYVQPKGDGIKIEPHMCYNGTPSITIYGRVPIGFEAMLAGDNEVRVTNSKG